MKQSISIVNFNVNKFIYDRINEDFLNFLYFVFSHLK
jgi:hypothetical protein